MLDIIIGIYGLILCTAVTVCICYSTYKIYNGGY